jgi:hypothetical protein
MGKRSGSFALVTSEARIHISKANHTDLGKFDHGKRNPRPVDHYLLMPHQRWPTVFCLPSPQQPRGRGLAAFANQLAQLAGKIAGIPEPPHLGKRPARLESLTR